MAESRPILINRAPVLTLWAAVVAQRLGFDREEGLTLGKAVAGLNAYSKGRSLGLFEPKAASLKTVRERARKKKDAGAFDVALLQRAVSVVPTPDGLRALVKDKPVDPAGVERYLKSKFGEEDLAAVEKAMRMLAKSRTPARLAVEAYTLYERFRPEIPAGVAGWGAKGVLDLEKIEGLARLPSQNSKSTRQSSAR